MFKDITECHKNWRAKLIREVKLIRKKQKITKVNVEPKKRASIAVEDNKLKLMKKEQKRGLKLAPNKKSKFGR